MPTFLNAVVHVLIYGGCLFVALAFAWTIYLWKIRPREDWKREIPMKPNDYRKGALDE
jgi:hypothetical protein